MFQKSARSGFTLIEMLIVIVIVGILAAALIPRLTGIQARARDTAREADMRNISTAIETYAIDHGGQYPSASFVVREPSLSPLPFFSIPHTFAKEATSSLETIASELQPYLNTIPLDPNLRGLATTNAGNCILKGESYAYLTTPTMYAITSLKESQKGNSDSCGGIINSKDGSYQVTGKGLSYTLTSNGSYPSEDKWTPSEQFIFNNGTISSYNGPDNADVIIPATINGQPVTTIGADAFLDKWMTSVTIPHTVTSIGVNGFSENSLTSITIPDSVTSIGAYAFNSNRLTSVTIPEGITSLEEGVFGSNQLTSFIFPDSVTSIGAYAFANNKLTSITIPDSVTSIRDGTFSYNKLTSITIPATVTSIEQFAFYDNNITSLSLGNYVSSIGDHAFRYNKLVTFTLPRTADSIGNNAFRNNGPNKDSSGSLQGRATLSTSPQTRNLVGTDWVKQ